MRSEQKFAIQTSAKLVAVMVIVFLLAATLSVYAVLDLLEQPGISTRGVLIVIISVVLSVTMGAVANSMRRKLTIDGTIMTEASGIVTKTPKSIDLNTVTRITAATAYGRRGAWYSIKLHSAHASNSMDILLSAYARRDAQRFLDTIEWLLQKPGVLDDSEETQKTICRIHPGVAIPTTAATQKSLAAGKRSPKLRVLVAVLGGIVVIGIFATLVYVSANERENCRSLASRGVVTSAAVTGLTLKDGKAIVESPSEATSIYVQLSYEADSKPQTVTRGVSFDSNDNLMTMYNDIRSGTPLSISYLPENPTAMKFNTVYEKGTSYSCS